MEYYIVSLTNLEKQLKKNQLWVTDSDIFIEEAGLILWFSKKKKQNFTK